MYRPALATALSIAITVSASAQNVVTRQVGTATLQGVPGIPPDVREAVQRYQNSRAGQFEDWLPDGSMLIATRFGATQQLHHVKAPGAARTQITFGAEPVAGARVIPGSDRFVMSRDTGGDEWFQLHARGIAGTATQLTVPGTRNQSPVFSKDGSLLAWAQARKGSAAYTLLGLDPKQGGTPRTLYRAEGAVAPADIADDKSRLVFVRGISNREDQLFELDLARGAAARIAPKAAPAVYQDPRYLPCGKRLIAISDHDSDTRQLVEIDLATGAQTVLTPGLKWDVERYDLTDDGRTLAYSVNEDGFSRVVVQDRITGRALPQPRLPRGVLTALEFSPGGRQLAIGLTSATSAGDVWSWDVAGAALTRWTISELGELDPSRLAEPELIRFRSFDGLSVPAFVYRPKGLPAEARTPVIIDIHGGPESQTRPAWNYGAQYFADVLKAP
jgi:dipeptidyl aminopeptidase/acylaminoacyl peptidase